MLEELEQAAKAILGSVGPLVVQIGREGRGSGIVVGRGLVLTNAHNLHDRTTSVTPPGAAPTQGSAAGVDIDGDLAVVRVDGAPATSGGGPTALHDADLAWRLDPISAGTPIFALSGGPAGARISFGLVSAVGREFRGPHGRRISGSLEHTAPLPRGASGGPVVDAAGRLVGINTHRLGHGAYLAVPATDQLRQRVEALSRGELPAHRRLGVALAPPSVARNLRRSVGLPERDGLLVRSTAPGGPAERAGLQEGDLLVAADGHALTSLDDLYDALDGDAPELRLTVVRGAAESIVPVGFAPPTGSVRPDGAEATEGTADTGTTETPDGGGAV